MVAHEFFDALPIHAFQTVTVNQKPKTPTTTAPPQPASSEAAVEASPATTMSETSSTVNSSTPTVEWRELVVSPVPPDSTHATLNTPQSQRDGPVPEFQLTQSTSPTHHARYVPESSPRYRALKTMAGATIEVCPDATMFAADLATRIGGSSDHPKPRPSGAALILDYGTSDTVPINSLRGIRRHRLVSPFTEPGLVDLSADVDFTALADSATKASPGVEVHGPVEQAAFLGQMGIRERAEMLTKRPGMPQKRQDDIDRSWRRLVDRGPGGMGKVYKVLAILPENRGQRRPVGFGGDI
jgi:NADH dehydrogenase [ubiquinone] 1 alpha subcomplex assembly factor 7